MEFNQEGQGELHAHDAKLPCGYEIAVYDRGAASGVAYLAETLCQSEILPMSEVLLAEYESIHSRDGYALDLMEERIFIREKEAAGDRHDVRTITSQERWKEFAHDLQSIGCRI